MKLEIYSKDWCPYCAKAKALLRSEGIGYEELDVTHDKEREQEMVDRSGRRTVPQLFLDGQPLGGYDDLAKLHGQGLLKSMLGLKDRSAGIDVYDVVIVGAGPAGLSAGLYTARKNLTTLVLAYDLGGQMGTTYEIANYPGVGQTNGPDLVDSFLVQAQEAGVEIRLGQMVESVASSEGFKEIRTQAGERIRARAVIVATGAFKRKLGVPGEKQLQGRGVVYCSTCDGPLLHGKSVAVVGGGNSGLEAAIEMSGIAREVFLISEHAWTGDGVLQDKLSTLSNLTQLPFHRPLEIHGRDQVNGLTLLDVRTEREKRLELDAVFVEIGLTPNSGFLTQMLALNERGEVPVERSGATTLDGIFAAGDVTTDDKQIVVAAGSGARAGLAAFNYLARS
jgi:alkyl hydroperoxide reductase subunit F